MLGEAGLRQANLRLAQEARDFFLPALPGGDDAAAAAWPPVLSRPPTALEFARVVGRSAPILINGALDDRLQAWQSTSHLASRLGTAAFAVALTPDGRADDVVKLENGQHVFALPHEEQMDFAALLRALHPSDSRAPVAYLQSQNSNLTAEAALQPLHADLLGDSGELPFAWATEALGKEAEAVNVWIGTQRSRTSLHRDHYENLFHVVRGEKTFILYAPTERFFLCEGEPLAVHQWHRSPTSVGHAFKLEEARDMPRTPWVMVDAFAPPDSPRNASHARFAHALPPLRVRVRAGQTFYLPAGWFHAVAQQEDDGGGEGPEAGLCVCFNLWYESEAAFTDRWALSQFVHELGQRAAGTYQNE